MDVLKKLSLIGIVPVIAIENADDAVDLAGALCRGGLPTAEVTFRTDAAEEAIKQMHKSYPNMILGAGTVLSPEQADKAMIAGASFIVSPGLNPDVVRHCINSGYPIVPGISTPTELELAMSLGLDTVKFFPAEAAGGVAMLKAMSAPYSGIKFMPTGGIGKSNLNSYLSLKSVFACGGSWMASKGMISNHEFDSIERAAKEAVNTMLGLDLHHVGINSDIERGHCIASSLSSFLGVNSIDTDISAWTGDFVEIMKGNGRGDCGHIAFSTNNVDRAVYHLQMRGMKFDDATSKYDANGNRTFIYSSDVLGGFAFHLVKKD